MVISGFRYGVYTDHASWQFLMLDEKCIRYSKKIALMKPEYDEFDQSAVSVFCFLFDVLGVDPNVDLEVAADRVESWRCDRAKTLVSLLVPTSGSV